MTTIPDMLGVPTTATILPLRPPIIANLTSRRSSNTAMADSFDKGHVYGLLKDWAVPAKAAGCDGLLLRELEYPRLWLDSLYEAMVILGIDSGNNVLYTNPVGLVESPDPWGWHDLNRLVEWCIKTNWMIGFELVDEMRWCREAIESAGCLYAVEPGIATNDTAALNYTSIIASDHEAKIRVDNAGLWSDGQQDPRTQPSGYIPWYVRPELEKRPPAECVTQWYARERTNPKCRAVIVPADYFAHPVNLTCAQIRGEAP